VSTSMSNVRQ